MQSRYAQLFRFIIIAGDLLLLNSCFVVAAALRFDEIRLQDTAYYDYYLQLIIFFNISWLFLTFVFRTYDTRRTVEPRKAASKVLNVYFIHLFLLLLVLVSLKRDVYSRLFLIYFYSFLFLTVIPWRFIFLRLLRTYRKKGMNFRKAVLLGSGQQLSRFYNTVLKHPEYGIRVEGYFSDNPVPGIPVSGSEAALEDLLGENKIDELYCAFPPGDEKLLRWFRIADDHLIRYRVIPDLGLEYSRKIDIDFYHDVPVLVHRKEPLEYIHNRWIKRFWDILISLAMILVVFPWLFPLLAIGVKLSSSGPVLFRQKRTGLRNRSFHIYKFRTMRGEGDADKPRLTKFGSFLRKYSLDELPQFFNVLAGYMSIVGPRPHMLSHTEQYQALIERFMVRHLAKPGITGLAQISGYRGEVHSRHDIEERVRLDVYYIENWSVLLDFKIIVLTFWNMLRGK